MTRTSRRDIGLLVAALYLDLYDRSAERATPRSRENRFSALGTRHSAFRKRSRVALPLQLLGPPMQSSSADEVAHR